MEWKPGHLNPLTGQISYLAGKKVEVKVAGPCGIGRFFVRIV